jgi:pimeloyl-ACP methyl ester carboxylesterase
MPFLTLNDQRIYYCSEGEGPPVILLHNATSSTQDWRYLMPRLADAGYRAIAYDRLGFGRSDPLARWPLDYLHRDRDELIALMDALGLEEAALLGNSDGATISLLTASAFPQRVVLVVAESPHMWYEQEHLAQGFQHFRETLEKDPRFIKTMRRAHGKQADEVISRWQNRWLDPAFFSWDEREALEQVRCPAFIIHGGRDMFFPVSHSQEIANSLSDSELLLWPDVGHTPHLERPHEYARHVITFLNTIRR